MVDGVWVAVTVAVAVAVAAVAVAVVAVEVVLVVVLVVLVVELATADTGGDPCLDNPGRCACHKLTNPFIACLGWIA